MGEKRFTDVNVDFEQSWIRLKDNGYFLIFPISFNDKEEYGLETLEDLLNGLSDKIDEQQATIQFLQDEIDELKKDIDIYEYEEKKHSETARKLYDENERLKQKLEDIGLNEKNDMVKMIDGKVFIRM